MTPTASYRLGNETISPGSENWSDLLARAYAAKERPLCLCSTPPSPMYIARSAGGYVIKRMPDTGEQHAPDCGSYDAPSALSGLGLVANKAILSDQDGSTLLKLGFPVTMRQGSRAPAAESSGCARSAVAPTSKLSLIAMLHFLWERSELSKWHPRMKDKRNWWIVRRELQESLRESRTANVKLADITFIPAPFRADKKVELEAERKAFMHRLMSGQTKNLGILIGEMKTVGPTAYGSKIMIKHMPDYPFFMNEDLTRRFKKQFRQMLLDLETYNDSHFVLIATFLPSEQRGEIKEVAGMLVTDTWIPFESARELTLLAALKDRSFIKCPRYNLSLEATIASAVLTDCHPARVLFCDSGERSQDEDRIMEDIQLAGRLPAWRWDWKDVDMPALPPLSGLVEREVYHN